MLCRTTHVMLLYLMRGETIYGFVLREGDFAVCETRKAAKAYVS